ncbi:DUF308 domain-containing protein [Microcoleus sp. T2B6]|uniref:hypothetical protein n=1 Tax=unclassified Microcoleus TaxID=2642155 RepID=UPI002FD3C8FA
MSQAPNNSSNWLFFLLGVLLFVQGAFGLHGYFTTGDAVFRHQKNIPLDLYGSDAALMHLAFFVFGAIFIASGVRGLLRK